MSSLSPISSEAVSGVALEQAANLLLPAANSFALSGAVPSVGVLRVVDIAGAVQFALTPTAPAHAGTLVQIPVPLAGSYALTSPLPIVRSAIHVDPPAASYLLAVKVPVVDGIPVFTMDDSISAGATPGFGIGSPMSETVTITDAFSPEAAYRLLETLGFTDSLLVSSTIFAAMSEAIGVREALLYILRVLVAHEVTLADTSDAVAHRLLLAAELLSVVATATNTSASNATAEEAMVVAEALRYTASALAEEGIDLLDVLSVLAARSATATEALTLLLADTLPTGTFYGALSESATLRNILRYTATAFASESFSMTFSESTEVLRILEAIEALEVGDVLTSEANELYAALAEQVDLRDLLRYTAQAIAEDSATFTGTSSIEAHRIAKMADTLALVANNATTLAVYGSLLEVLTVQELAALAFNMTAEEIAQLGDSLSAALIGRVAGEESLELGEELAPLFTFVGRATETLDLSDTAPVSLIAALMSTEGVAFVERLPLGDDDFQMWVMNAENLGLTQYRNCPFNSVVSHEGKSFGVSETGIYEWTGNDDAGSEIDAYFSTGMMTFGDSMRRKSIPRAYLYMASDSRVYLRTITDERTGDRRQRWYQIEARSGDVLQTRRVKLARGVKAVSWKVEVTNVDGGTLDVRGLDVLPVILRRKP